MSKSLYKYKVPKSGNEETNFLFTKGRISRKAFSLRLLLAVSIFIVFDLIFNSYVLPKYQTYGVENKYDVRFISSFQNFKFFVFIVLPFLLFIFTSIQAIKRIHDVNKSGLYVLFPLYNLFLLFSPGTKGNNDFGIDPNPVKGIEYFDQLPKEIKPKA